MYNKKTSAKSNWMANAVASRTFRIAVFLWFVFQAAYMAISTRPGISPDETYHFSLIQLFAKNGWLPFIHSQTGFYQLGEVVHLPIFLYHYLLSLPYHLFSGSSHSLVILRLINIVFGVLSFYFVAKIADRLGATALVKNLSLFMLSNTLMFVFLAGMLNYDNLFILLSLMDFYFLLRLIEKFNFTYLLMLFIVSLANLLTVINAWPIVASVLVVLIFKYRSLDIKFRRDILDPLHQTGNLLLLIPLILLSLLFVQRYVVNVVEYHSPIPACQKVNTPAQCEKNPIIQRDEAFNAAAPPSDLSSVTSYFGTWATWMRVRTFGIFGHKLTDATKLIDTWSFILLALFAIAIIRRLSPGDIKISVLLGISIFYGLVLYLDNYSAYRHTGVTGAAAQGRYLFPFLPLIYIIGNRYLLQIIRGRYLQPLYIAITLIVFITASLPSYLLETDNSWYTDRTSSVNQKLHNKLESTYRALK